MRDRPRLRYGLVEARKPERNIIVPELAKTAKFLLNLKMIGNKCVFKMFPEGYIVCAISGQWFKKINN